MNKIIRLISFGVLAVPVWACGPFFPSTILDRPDAVLSWSPTAPFPVELDRAFPRGAPAYPARPGDTDQLLEAERDELRARLNEDGGMTPGEVLALARYMEIRTLLATRAVSRDRNETGERAPVPPVVIPSDLPAEFADYLRGAAAWHAGQTNEARQAWARVLALPEGARHYRSTWAAYMLGRSFVDSEPDEAIRYLRQVRDEVDHGFADAVGLAAASLGWEARAELLAGRPARAIELYRSQREAGDPTATASLWVVANRVLRGSEKMRRMAAVNPVARTVITARVLAGNTAPFPSSPYGSSCETNAETLWLETVEAVGADALDGADRLAWAAYSAGQMDMAARWLARLSRPTPLSQWIEAKLALRRGEIPQAVGLLQAALAGWAADPTLGESNRQALAGELAALYTSASRYGEALDLLVRHGWWWDASYLAERVLTTDELVAWVDERWPEDERSYDENGDLVGDTYDDTGSAKTPSGLIRFILARRLAREGRWAQAGPYYPPRWRGPATRYAGLLADAGRPGTPAAERARSLWQAARIARAQGMELMGCELEPDWTTSAGAYDPPAMADRRRQARAVRLAPPSPDEQRRVDRHRERHPARRFHYRYVAADLAWEAAQLMPDESDETARMLEQAGRWLKHRDPSGADRFYKALVTRCGTTALGREADRLRWFPPSPASAAE